MKNALKTFTVAAIAVFMIICNADGQTTIRNSSTNGEMGTSTPVTDDSQRNIDVSNTISVQALKDFQKKFKRITNVEWFKAGRGGCIARFTEDHVETMVTYNPNGIWQNTIYRYNEEKSPRYVRNIVKNGYHNYTIRNIAEVYFNDQYFNDQTVYVIYLQDETHLKTISICDGQMQEVKN